MADLKISQLSDGGASQATDEYVVARSGSNFRIDGASVAAAATSVGTLSSLTVSGDLTVDTSTLKVDSANNRVGIGTASPSVTLHASIAGAGMQEVAWLNNGQAVGAGVGSRLTFTGTTNNNGLASIEGAFAGATTADGGYMVFRTRAVTSGSLTEYMRLDASGNLGLGVTPDTWGGKVLQFANGIGYGTRTANGSALMTQNAILDGSDVWKYKANAGATAYQQVGGVHYWSVAGAGTGTITGFNSSAMTLDASGNLGVGTASPGYRLHAFTSDGNIARFTRDLTTDAHFTIGADDNGTILQSSGVDVMRFWTGSTERARITSGGFFKASNDGTYRSSTANYHELRTNTNDVETAIFSSNAANGTQYGIAIYTANDQNDTKYFLQCNGNTTERATIRTNGGLANYSANNVNLASDERLKKDIAPLTSTWNKVKAIEVVNFRYKDCNEGDPALYGVIAQQVQPIVPELVVVTREAVEAKDAELDEDGNEVKPAVEAAPEYYGIREQPMYWLAIKALQEAQARIEALEARLEALEA